MDYISTKELAKEWSMDTSRVLRLAKEGRIPGAKRIGKSWAFPADLQKLPDLRKKDNKPKAGKQIFRFPLYYYYAYGEDELRTFTRDERTLYDVETDFLKGHFGAYDTILTELKKNTTDQNVKIGALYILCMTYIFQKKIHHAIACFQELKMIFSKEFPHKKVLILLFHDLESYYTGNSFYLENFSLRLDSEYLPQLRDYYILQIAFSEMIRSSIEGAAANALPYELYLLAEEHAMAPLSAVLLHLYTAIIYFGASDKEYAVAHLLKSCKIAEEFEAERAILFAMQYLPELFCVVLQEHNPKQLTRLQRMSKEATDSFNGLHDAMGVHNILNQLDSTDTKFVMFAEQGKTNKEISKILGLSVNTISKRYSLIFEKTGAHSKKELVSMYIDAMKNYDTDMMRTF